MTSSSREGRVAELRRTRPRDRMMRINLILCGLLVVWAWTSGALDLADLTTERAQRNLSRFLTEIQPYPLQGKDWNWGVYWQWLAETLGDSAPRAVSSTLALSVTAAVLAGLWSLLLAPVSAGNLARPFPFGLPGRSGAVVRNLWAILRGVSRFVAVLLRSIPEYIWAFLLLTLLGVGAWPAVLALALHNAGILGRLYRETIENADERAAASHAAFGAGRAQIFAGALLPQLMGRYLLYFFYRWETCVREATVLGLLGFVSLGWYIQEARAGVRYDEMLLFVLLGSALILAGDGVSAWLRRLVRESS